MLHENCTNILCIHWQILKDLPTKFDVNFQSNFISLALAFSEKDDREVIFHLDHWFKTELFLYYFFFLLAQHFLRPAVAAEGPISGVGGRCSTRLNRIGLLPQHLSSHQKGTKQKSGGLSGTLKTTLSILLSQNRSVFPAVPSRSLSKRIFLGCSL